MQTTFVTVISGVLVYIFSQIFFEKFLNPSKELKILKRKIIFSLSMYSSYYINPYKLNSNDNVRDKKEYETARMEMRKLGSELSAHIAVTFRKKKKEELQIVLDNIISLSNGFFDYQNGYDVIKENINCEKKIKELLKIK